MYPLIMGVLIKPFFSMFGELFLGENTGYLYSDLVDPIQSDQNASSFDTTVCSRVASQSEFLQLGNGIKMQLVK
jgi:hypothetical protein